MSLETILIWLFIFGVVTGLIFAALNLFGATVYDFLFLYRKRALDKRPYNKIYRYRPTVSVIVPVHNEEQVIERCLRSLISSTYRKYEIIVADDASTDDTRRVVKEFIAVHPNKSVKLVAKRKNGGRGAALDAGIKKASGELIMALDADCVLNRKTLSIMVRHFADPQTAATAANIRIMDNGDVISLLQQFDYLISFRSKKFNTLANSEYIIGGAGATYRRDVIRQLKGFDHTMKTEDIEMSLRIAHMLGNKASSLKYASDVVIYTEPVNSYRDLFKQRFRWKFGSLQALYKHRHLLFSRREKHSKLLSWLRLPFVLWSELMLILEPILFSYFLYLALINRSVILYASACLVIALLALLAVWADEHLSSVQKIRLSVYAPIVYPLMFVLSVIQVAAAFKCLSNTLALIGKKEVVGSYTSPVRIGNRLNKKATTTI